VVAAFLLWDRFAVALWNPLIDVDLWWQMWAGRRMLDGHFPSQNGLAWTAPEHPWVSHEPLVALLYGQVGLAGMGAVRAVVVSAFALVLGWLAWRPRAGWASLLALFWALQLCTFGVTERALTFGNLMLAVLMGLLFGGGSLPPVLEDTGRRRQVRLLVAAVWTGLWASVHGSFVIGVLAVGLVSWRHGLLAAGLTLCNPSGPALWTLVIGYGTGREAQGVVHRMVVEWQPLWPTSLDAAWRLVCLLGGAAVVMSGKGWRGRVLALFTTLLCLRHQRYGDVAALACLPFVVTRLAGWLPGRQMLAPALLLAPILVVTYAVSPPIRVHPASFPPGLPAAIPAGARLFNSFELGGYLGEQGVKVFFDPRNDCYPASVLEDGFRVQRFRPGWEETLHRWQVDTVATRDPRLIKALGERGWPDRATFPGDQHRAGVHVLVRPPR
jgi:hypothetical protein